MMSSSWSASEMAWDKFQILKESLGRESIETTFHYHHHAAVLLKEGYDRAMGVSAERDTWSAENE